jgi:CRP/FNR family transcriptional regulator, cyclic AMP receptor protein
MADVDKPVAVVRLELKHVDLKELLQLDELLGKAPLFRAAGPEGTRRLVETATPRKLSAGQTVFKQGERGANLFMVLRGEVTLGHDAAVVATARKGDFFGEAEVLSPKSPRGCTATAAGPADVAEFPLAEVGPLLQAHLALYALLRECRDARAKANSELDDFLNRW